MSLLKEVSNVFAPCWSCCFFKAFAFCFKTEFAKLNVRKIFEKTKIAKYDFFDLAILNPRENLSD